MSSSQADARIQALEARVSRLAEFNQLLLDYLIATQDFSGTGKGPTPQNVNRWVINLSDSVWTRYRGASKF